VTWIQIVNEVLKAHRNRDMVAEAYWIGLLDEVEPTYADFLDTIDY
jgi:hypothetical protein